MGLPGVGQRLMDHPSISLSSFVRRGARMNEHTRRHMQLGLRYSSGLAGVPKGDMFVVLKAIASPDTINSFADQVAAQLK